MKGLWSLLMLFLLSAYSIAQKQKGFTITHLTGDFYVYTTWQDIDGKPYPANGMYVLTAKGIIIIDCPWDTAQAIPLLDSIEKHHHSKAIAAIATHFHSDRTGSFDIFHRRGIKTYSSCQTLQLCIDRHEPQAEYCFSADTTFDFGDHKVQTFYPGQGHTADNIVLWFDDAKVLYGGCFIKSCEADDIGNIADANLKEWSLAIAKVKSRFPHPAFVIPGHQSWTCGKAIDHTLALIRKKQKSK